MTRYLLFIVAVFVISMGSCTHYITLHETVTKHDTIPVEVEKLVPLNSNNTIDTIVLFDNGDTLYLKVDSDYVFIKLGAPPSIITTTSEAQIPVSLYKQAIRQRERTIRDSMDKVFDFYESREEVMQNMYEDSLKTVRIMFADSLKAWRKVTQTQIRKDDAVKKVEARGGGFFSRIKNALFWLVIGIIVGLLLRSLIKFPFLPVKI